MKAKSIVIIILISGLFFAACEEETETSLLMLTRIVPMSDGPGTEVNIFGRGFGHDLASITVSFNGTQASISSVNDSIIIVTVPKEAETGKINIQVNNNRIRSEQDFVVLKGLWREMSEIPFVKGFGASVGFAINNIGYLGTGSDNGSFLDEFWKYSPSTNQWSAISNIPNGKRHFCSSFSIGENAFIGLGRKDGESELTQEFYRFNTIEDAWSRLNEFPKEAAGLLDLNVGFSYGEKGYLIIEKELWEYNPLLDVWAFKNNYPGQGSSGLIAEVIGDFAYVGLGFNNAFDWWKYDLINENWMPLANPPFDISWDLQSFIIEDNIYVIGKENWEYSTTNDEWIQRTSHPDGRRFATTFSINGKGYLGTGISIKTSRFQNDFWEFTIE